MKLDFDFFKKLVPIKLLKPPYQEELAQFTRIQELKAGETLFRRGDTDKSLYYLQAGQIELIPAELPPQTIAAGTEQALYPLANIKPRQFTGVVISKSAVFLRVSHHLLERMLAWEQIAIDTESGIQLPSDKVDEGDRGWISALLKTKAFLRLPSGNIHRLFESFEPIRVKAGDFIIRQGSHGDYFYVIKEGRCRVTRKRGTGEYTLAELEQYDSFGEEALVSGAPRNANVSMITDGVLMRLSKAQFSELLEQPILKWVNLAEAGRLVQQGATKLDVRLENEFRYNGLPGAVNIPLYMLRIKAQQLSARNKYVLYCDTGERSAAAAFLLGARGFDVYVLKDGLAAVRRGTAMA